MSKIFEALEHSAREKRGWKRKSGVIIPVRYPLNTYKLDIEDEMINLYQSIDSLLSYAPKKVIQFIGSREGEGTSTIVREFARISARKFDKTVFLLDADSQKPSQHISFNIKPEYGLEDILDNNIPLERALYKANETANLFVGLLSVDSASNAQVFNSARLDYLWEQLRQRFDLILVDSPPATLSPDGSAISQRVDGTVLVLEAEKTRWPVAESVKDKVTNNGGKILGVILNKRQYYIPEFIYKKL